MENQFVENLGLVASIVEFLNSEGNLEILISILKSHEFLASILAKIFDLLPNNILDMIRPWWKLLKPILEKNLTEDVVIIDGIRYVKAPNS